jgi:hypothetical protein
VSGIAQNSRHKILIIGGGTAGLTVAARLTRGGGESDVAIIEPSEKHFYQPLRTLVGSAERRPRVLRATTSERASRGSKTGRAKFLPSPNMSRLVRVRATARTRSKRQYPSSTSLCGQKKGLLLPPTDSFRALRPGPVRRCGLENSARWLRGAVTPGPDSVREIHESFEHSGRAISR